MALSKNHYIHSRNGQIGVNVDHSAKDIDEIIRTIQESNSDRLIIHFHGGLVSKKSALETAERLNPIYSEGGYPLFFVWESGAWETVRNNLADISKEPIFQELVRKVLEFVLGKLGIQEGVRSISGQQIDPDKIKQQLNAWFIDPANSAVPYSEWAHHTQGDSRSVISTIDENEIQLNLEADTDFLNALQSISDVPKNVRSAMNIGNVPPSSSKIDAAVRAELAPAEPDATRGVFSLVKVAMTLAKVVARVIKRFLSSRDHGFYATVVEEILREFYGDIIGQSIFWNQMKKDTQDAFGGDPDLHVGTALLTRLKPVLEKGAFKKIFLIGHSTGGIYISNFLKAVDDMQIESSVQFEVILLAPANTHKLFNETIQNHGNRIRSLRLFGMKDEVERDDGLLGDDWKRAIYPSSLLYFVSGLLEYEVDAPLLGMQRFHNLNSLFNAPGYPESDQLRTWLTQSEDRLVWSKTDDGKGRCSQARKHGDFDNDEQTLASLVWIVTH